MSAITSTPDASATAAAPPQRRVRVEVISDIMWPWCWIGKRNLEAAVADLAAADAGVAVDISWRPFFLRPNMPADGRLKEERDPKKRAGARLKAAGARAGIDFTGLTDRSPNSTLAHSLMKHVLDTDGPGIQNKLSEILFRHYFTDGRYPNAENVRAAAVEAGVKDVDAAMAAAVDPSVQGAVKQEARYYSREGVSGVPFFLVDGKPAFSGAQPKEAFKKVLEQAL